VGQTDRQPPWEGILSPKVFWARRGGRESQHQRDARCPWAALWTSRPSRAAVPKPVNFSIERGALEQFEQAKRPETS
jgi:hypothetical protein